MGKNKNGAFFGQLGNFTIENGYVFYQRITEDSDLSTNKIWSGKVYAGFKKTTDENESTLKNIKLNNVADILESTGLAEQKKEINMLRQVFGASLPDKIDQKEYYMYINTINELIGMKDKYKDYLSELQAQAKDTKNRRAAGGFRYFESRLVPAINENIRAVLASFSEEKIFSMTAEDFTRIIQDVLEKSIEDAVNKVADSNSGYIGSIKLWTEIREGFRRLNTTNRNNFMNEIISRYDLLGVSERIGEKLQQYFSKSKTEQKKNKLYLSSMIKTEMNINELKGSSLDGFISEFLPSLLTPAGKGTGLVFKNNILKTDSVQILTGTIGAEIPEDIIEEGNELFSKDLEEATQKMEAFTQNVLDKVQDGFVIYESSKMYRLSGSFSTRGFHGTSGSLSNLGSALAQYGTPAKLSYNIANIVYQTIPGAILAGQRKSIIQSIRKMIIENIMAAMFDDVKFQGVNTDNERVIHMLNLNGVQIPLSYYCLSLADAIRNSLIEKSGSQISSYVSVSISTPKNILYPVKVNSTPETTIVDDSGNQIDFPESLFIAWNRQAQDAQANSKFAISFLRNFNDILEQLQKNLV